MNSDLLQRIESFELDDLSSNFKFSDRLARENSWTIEFAQRCLTEYKRFLFLSAEAGHPVTPSVAVDHSWHLHLCYTRSYWNDLCEDTLGFPLHHGPTKGGKQESEKFNQWYQKTLDSYTRLFGTEPPADIWPAPEVRFSTQDIKNIDLNKHFVVSKKTTLRALAAGALSFCVIGCTSSLSKPDILAIGSLVVISTVAVCLAKLIFGGGGGGKGGGGSGCSSGCGGGGCGGD